MVSLHRHRTLTKTLSRSFLRFFFILSFPLLLLNMPCLFVSQVDLHSNFSKPFLALLQITVAHLERSMGYVSILLNRSLGTSCSDSNLYLASISTLRTSALCSRPPFTIFSVFSFLQFFCFFAGKTNK